jgi:multiple sugar transport system substrate-binding protein
MGALPYFKEPTTIVLSVPKVIFAATKHPDEAFVFYLYISDPTKVELFKTGLWAPLEKRYFTDPAFTKEWLEGQPGVYPPEARDVLIDYTLNHASPPPPMYWLRNIDRIMNEAVPSTVPVIASSVLWLWLFNPEFGLLNAMLTSFGVPKQQWIYDEDTVLPSLS